jgi:hypothetical protein
MARMTIYLNRNGTNAGILVVEWGKCDILGLEWGKRGVLGVEWSKGGVLGLEWGKHAYWMKMYHRAKYILTKHITASGTSSHSYDFAVSVLCVMCYLCYHDKQSSV